MNKLWIVLLGGVFGASCGEVHLDAGSTTDQDASDAVGVPWPHTPSNSFEFPCTKPAPDWLAGTWRGEFDTFALPSRSKAVRIEVTGAPQYGEGFCGTVTFGTAEPPPVATDPAAAPPGSLEPLYLAQLANQNLVEGFPFEFAAANMVPGPDGGGFSLPETVLTLPPAIEDRRIRFVITLSQVYKSWCNLQRAFRRPTDDSKLATPAPDFVCTPPDFVLPVSPGGTPCAGEGPLTGITVHGVSCEQATFCLANLCTCGDGGQNLVVFGQQLIPIAGVAGCTVLPNSSSPFFDLTANDAALSGSVVLDQKSVETMHLTRVL